MTGTPDLRALVTGASSGIGAAYARALRARGELDRRGVAVDTLVSCAGLGHTAAFETQRPEAIRAMLDVNVRAVVELAQAFLPGMRSRGRGWIVNVASTAAFQPVRYLTRLRGPAPRPPRAHPSRGRRALPAPWGGANRHPS
jgi:short-subunit dehydrogenase